jgi:hypothetical protein
MTGINSALRLSGTSNYGIDDILRSTQTPSKGSGFRRILGSIVGGVGNMLAPGIGGMIGNAIGGAGSMGDAASFLALQRQVNQEQEAIETASSMMKARHDAAMAAIRNMS